MIYSILPYGDRYVRNGYKAYSYREDIILHFEAVNLKHSKSIPAQYIKRNLYNINIWIIDA